MFHLFKIISLLPLAACLPPFSREEASHIGDGMLATEQRWVDLAQFDWDDYVLTGVSLDCQRQAPQDLYSCEYKCKATTSRVVSRSDDFELTNTVHWEDPNFDNSINCNATFDWDGITQEHGENNTYPTGYQICGYWWQFQFDQLRSLWDFNMTITKDQKDPMYVFVFRRLSAEN